jgi:hypothetical protein
MKETLIKCRDHWQWLADNPDKEKTEWPGLDPGIQDECYCCEYAEHRRREEDLFHSQMCQLCPLLGIAWGSKTDYKWPGCVNDRNSFYYKWSRANDSGRLKHKKLWAQRIADACTKALKALT